MTKKRLYLWKKLRIFFQNSREQIRAREISAVKITRFLKSTNIYISINFFKTSLYFCFQNFGRILTLRYLNVTQSVGQCVISGNLYLSTLTNTTTISVALLSKAWVFILSIYFILVSNFGSIEERFFCECCKLSCSGTILRLIIRPEDSSRMWWVWF